MICFPYSHLCPVSGLWSGQSASWHCAALWQEVRGAVPSRLAGRQTEGRVGAAQVEEASEGGRDGQQEQNSFPDTLQPSKGLFVSDCSSRCMFNWADVLETDLGFCESEHQTLLCHFDLLIPDLCFVCCARSATCIVRPCAKEVTSLLDCR